ncbi:MAG TPA: hypothetical protein VMH90_03365 [Thermoplasmata archaeon]|nr:hypothetical protein [Thermoplasmata archaeon]
MSPVRSYWLLPVGALVLTALAFWTTDPGVATVLGGLAGGCAGVFLLLAALGRTRFEGIHVPEPDADALVVLTRSFRSGRFGREEILSRLDGYELALGVPGHRGSSETEALLAAPDAEFLDHVDERLRRLEGLS